MRSSRTRTNVGITSSRKGSPERPNSRKFQQSQSSDDFFRTSLPMFNSRGGKGDIKSAQDKWQFQSHDKTMPPTERISRQTGELAWKSAPPQVYTRPMDSSLRRANATVFNTLAYDKDQDGKLDEADLFHSTSAGFVGKKKEINNARDYLRKASIATVTSVKDDDDNNNDNINATTRTSTNQKNNNNDNNNNNNEELKTNTGKNNNKIDENKTFEENVEQIAKQRALVGEILHRNASHLELFSINPGKRNCVKSDHQKISWEECKGGPDPSTHFILSEPRSVQIDKAMDAVYDEKTYNGNFPLYIRDLYQNENRAKLVGSGNMKKIFSPLRSDGGKSALNPPPTTQNNNNINNNNFTEGGQFDMNQVNDMTGVQKSDRRPVTAPAANNSSSANSTVQTFGTVDGSIFTSAFKQSNYYDSDHGESYEGQWNKSKTLGNTSRGVRQKGEHHCVAGGLGKPSGSSKREGRLTITRHLGPSRPYTTNGISTNLDMRNKGNNMNRHPATSSSSPAASPTSKNNSNTQNNNMKEGGGPHNIKPKGRWTNPDRGRQLPIVLFEDKTQNSDIKPNYFVPAVYSRDLSDEHLKNDSMSAWCSKAKSHEEAAWKRTPNSIFTGVVYNATIPRTPGNVF